MIQNSTTQVIPHAPKFSRIRRITGYLTGTVDRWNDAKKAELSQRVSHKLGQAQ